MARETTDLKEEVRPSSISEENFSSLTEFYKFDLIISNLIRNHSIFPPQNMSILMGQGDHRPKRRSSSSSISKPEFYRNLISIISEL
jgi:hypothetical protein